MSPKKGARRLAREYTLQGLYAWLISKQQAEIGLVETSVRNNPAFAQADPEWFTRLFHGIIKDYDHLVSQFEPYLDRPAAQLSCIENAVLLIAAYELEQAPEIPYRVVMNEAIELAKEYGATDGFKFVNGVLDKLATKLRSHEIPRH